MISGAVTSDLGAVVELRVRGPSGVEAEVSAVLDTGFTEFLTLPPALVSALALPYQYAIPMEMADARPLMVDVCEASVDWDGEARIAPVQCTQGEPLIGMSLLYGSRLLLDAVDGGPVRITALP